MSFFWWHVFDLSTEILSLFFLHHVHQHSISFVEKKDEIALQKLELGSKEGHWV